MAYLDASLQKSRAGQTAAAITVKAIAQTLATSWRSHPSTPCLDAPRLADAAQSLLQSGAGALTWWRIKDSDLALTDCGLEFRQSYRLHAMQSALHEREIAKVFTLLRSSGVEPLIVKGWAIARLYPDSALRPYDDIDLIVPDGQCRKTVALLDAREDKYDTVDVHSSTQLDRESFDKLFERSQLIMLGGVPVRLLSPEDHLRILCIHLLKHGAFRPLWLCDVAVAVENRDRNFDWKVCLTDNRRRAGWVRCAIALAHRLLGADIETTPLDVRNQRLPAWLIPCVLKQWEKPRGIDHAPSQLFMQSLRHSPSIPRAVMKRWRDPIRATICVEGSFNKTPRILYQMEDYLAQVAKFLVRIPGLVKEQSRG